MTKTSDPSASVLSPFTVVIDTREQIPYAFAGLRTDANQHRRPLIVSTLAGTLSAGDYSIQGLETWVAVERKSITDLFNTLGQHRDRFVRELERLSAFRATWVVVEAEWSRILYDPPPHSQLNPKTIMRSVNRWELRYPGIHWRFLPDRKHAEAVTYRLLEAYWLEMEKGQKLLTSKTDSSVHPRR